MHEQLISFEGAQLAKEKGFDEITRFHYGVYSEAKFEYNMEQDEEGNTICAPTQTALQKWLREHKSTRIWCQPSKQGNWIAFIEGTLIEESKSPTYEGALEIGIHEALKTI